MEKQDEETQGFEQAEFYKALLYTINNYLHIQESCY